MLIKRSSFRTSSYSHIKDVFKYVEKLSSDHSLNFASTHEENKTKLNLITILISLFLMYQERHNSFVYFEIVQINCSSDSESDEGEWDVPSPNEANNLELATASREFQDQPLILISGPSVQNIRECSTAILNKERK